MNNSQIIEPCFIGENVSISNSVIGPFVSIDKNSTIRNSVLMNSMIQKGCELKNVNCSNSMIGNHVMINKKSENLSLGDYNQILE